MKKNIKLIFIWLSLFLIILFILLSYFYNLLNSWKSNWTLNFNISEKFVVELNNMPNKKYLVDLNTKNGNIVYVDLNVDLYLGDFIAINDSKNNLFITESWYKVTYFWDLTKCVGCNNINVLDIDSDSYINLELHNNEWILSLNKIIWYVE